MQHYWDLSTIYPGLDSTEYQRDTDALIEKINTLSALELSDDFTRVAEEYIIQMNDILTLLYPLSTYVSLIVSTDTSNEAAIQKENKMSEISSLLTAPVVKFQKWLSNFSGKEITSNNSDLITEHRFFLEETHAKASHLLSDAEEVLLSKLQTVGSSAWSNLQGSLTSKLMIEFELDGVTKPYSLSMIRNFASHDNADVRKRAYDAEILAYKRIDEGIAASLNAIKGEVNLISELRGFQSPLRESAHKARLDIDSLNAMIEAMKDKLPSFHKYLNRKAELLGHKGGLPFYDLFAPISSSSLTYTYDEAKSFVIDNFGEFSPELANYAQTAFNNKWVDVEPREGKRGGAFCASIRGRKQSRIMLNFDGSFSQVSTMAHELGHGYHNSQVYNHTMINVGYTMPVAETASIFCETIVTNAAISKASKEDAIFILEKSIEGSTQVIVDILSRFIFEKRVFDTRNDGPISVDALKSIMLDAQKEAYGHGLDHDNLHPYMWICKPHYYSSGFSFYNYPYAFGLLFGKGLYAQYKSGRANFINDYNKLLNNTTLMDVKTVAATMDIDITKKTFWLDSLSMIEDEIEQFLALTQP